MLSTLRYTERAVTIRGNHLISSSYGARASHNKRELRASRQVGLVLETGIDETYQRIDRASCLGTFSGANFPVRGGSDPLTLAFQLPPLLSGSYVKKLTDMIYDWLPGIKCTRQEFLAVDIDQHLPSSWFSSAVLARLGLLESTLVTPVVSCQYITMRALSLLTPWSFHKYTFPRRASPVDLVRWCRYATQDHLSLVDRRDLNARFVFRIKRLLHAHLQPSLIAEHLMHIPITCEHPMCHPWLERTMSVLEGLAPRGVKVFYLPSSGYQVLDWLPDLPGYTHSIELTDDVTQRYGLPSPKVVYDGKARKCLSRRIVVDGRDVWIPESLIFLARLHCSFGLCFDDCVGAFSRAVVAKRDALFPTQEDYPGWNIQQLGMTCIAAVWRHMILDPRAAWSAWTSQMPSAEGWYAVPQRSAKGPLPDYNLCAGLDVHVRANPMNMYGCRCLTPEIPVIRGVEILPLFVVERTDESITQAIFKRVTRMRNKTIPATLYEQLDFKDWFKTYFANSVPIDTDDLRKKIERFARRKYGLTDDYHHFMEGANLCLEGNPPPVEWGRDFAVFIKREMYEKEATLRFIVCPVIAMRGYSKAACLRAELVWETDNPHTVKGRTPSQVVSMLAEFGKCVQQDSVGFEVLLDSDDLRLVEDCLCILAPCDEQLIRWYFTSINREHSLTSKDFKINKIPPMQISGSETTSIGNAIVNLFNVYVTLRRMGIHLEYDDHFIVEGDDFLMDRSVLDRYPLGDPVGVYSRVGSQLGMVLTLEEYDSPSDCAFLGYHLVATSKGYINSPVDLYVRLSKIFWTAHPDLGTNKHDASLLRARIRSACYQYAGSDLVRCLYEWASTTPAGPSTAYGELEGARYMQWLTDMDPELEYKVHNDSLLDFIRSFMSDEGPRLDLVKPDYASDVTYVGSMRSRPRQSYKERIISMSREALDNMFDLKPTASREDPPVASTTEARKPNEALQGESFLEQWLERSQFNNSNVDPTRAKWYHGVLPADAVQIHCPDPPEAHNTDMCYSNRQFSRKVGHNEFPCKVEFMGLPAYLDDERYMSAVNPAYEAERLKELKATRVYASHSQDCYIDDWSNYTAYDVGGNGACLCWAFVQSLMWCMQEFPADFTKTVQSLTSYIWQAHRAAGNLLDLPPIVKHIACYNDEKKDWLHVYFPDAPLSITVTMACTPSHYFALCRNADRPYSQRNISKKNKTPPPPPPVQNHGVRVEDEHGQEIPQMPEFRFRRRRPYYFNPEVLRHREVPMSEIARRAWLAAAFCVLGLGVLYMITLIAPARVLSHLPDVWPVQVAQQVYHTICIKPIYMATVLAAFVAIGLWSIRCDFTQTAFWTFATWLVGTWALRDWIIRVLMAPIKSCIKVFKPVIRRF